MRTFKTIEKELNGVIANNNLESRDYMFIDVMRKIRDKFIRNRISEFNTYKLEKHDLNHDYSNNEKLKELNNLDDLNEITLYISDFFASKVPMDRVNEINLSLKCEKVFTEFKYCSMYEIKKAYDVEGFKEKILNKCKKEIVLNVYGLSSYGSIRTEAYTKLIEVLNLYLGCDYTLTYKDLAKCENIKDIEEILNKLAGVKFRVFKDWCYISFDDSKKQNKLLNYLVNKEVEYFARE